MKRNASFLIMSFLTIFPTRGSAQSADRNYLFTLTALDTAGRMSTAVEYYDGMGRPILSLSDGISGRGNYVATRQDYDMMGRKTKSWLPVATGGNASYFMPDVSSAQKQYGDEYAFSQLYYDGLSRHVVTQGSGQEWWNGSHSSRTTYGTNGNDEVKLYKAPCDGKNHLVKAGYYPPCSLHSTCYTDEDGHRMTVFTDKLGRKVLERRNIDKSYNDTYFVYNDLGQLCFVLSPKFQENGDKALYAYEYRYDGRGNVVKKFLPGCGMVQYWYDEAGRPVFVQDAMMRGKGIFRFMLYDIFGRLAIQGTTTDMGGFINGSHLPVIHPTKAAQDGILHTGYSLEGGFSLRDAVLECVNYYDSYDYLHGEFRDTVFYGFVHTGGNAQGKLTGTAERASNGELISTLYEYDEKGRLTRTTHNGIGKTRTINNMKLSFTDKPVSDVYTVRLHDGREYRFNNNTTYNRYNDMPEKKKVSIYVNRSQVFANHETSDYNYDDIGRLSVITRPQKAGNITYGYNLRGWTTSITTPSFTEHLFYDDDCNSSSTPCYNGNISAQRWTNGNYDNPRWYRYSYDGLNRLVNSEYSERDDHGFAANRFNEQILEYDTNGNIERLQRHGRKQNGVYGKIDDLHIYHNGNQLDWVEDDAGKLYYAGAFDFNGDDNNEAHYKYNDNGALIEDTGRGITFIEYDNFNNPRRIQFSNGNVTKYVYSASGEKLRTIHYTAAPNIKVGTGQIYELEKDEILFTDSTDYIGNLILENNKPDMYLFSGGFCSFRKPYTEFSKPGKVYAKFLYYNNDHLGNVREVVDESGDVKQVNNYYPFGAPFSDNSISMSSPDFQKYKYIGKELDFVHGLNTYDHGARQNYSIIGVWDRVDPMAEKYYNISPYAVCGNNLILNVDKNGKDYYRNDETGAVLWIDGNQNFIYNENLRYRNIGSTYSLYQSGLRIDYNQNEIVDISSASAKYNVNNGVYLPHEFVTDDNTRVKVTFIYNSPTGGSGDKALDKRAVSLLISGVNDANNNGANINSIDVSTTTTGKHSPQSNHYAKNGGRAIDIDMINGISVRDCKTHKKVYMFQEALRKYKTLRENFGPEIQEKLNHIFKVSGHNNHIHISVNP